MEQCLIEFAVTPENVKHRVSIEFFEDGSKMARDCQRYVDEGVLSQEFW